MKNFNFIIIVWYVVLFACAQHIQAQVAPQPVTELQITESAFAQEHQFKVTMDSIIVDFTMYAETGPIRSRYARSISGNERNKLLASFNKIYLSTLKSSYEGLTNTDHDWNYELFIKKGEYIRVIKIFKYKLQPMYILGNELNQLLPNSFKISYTDNYFKE